MSEVFMEQVLNRKYSWLFSNLKSVESFFNPPSEMADCSLTDERRVWFNVPAQFACVLLKSEAKVFSGSLSVWAGNAPGDYQKKIGFVNVEDLTSEDNQARPGVILRLPKGQL